MTRYRCVDDQKAAGFPVATACRAAGVSTSAYYAWAARRAQRPSQRQRDEAALVAEIRHIHAESDGAYGAPRVTVELGRRGRTVNHKRVERLMRVHGIVGHRPRRRRWSTALFDQARPAGGAGARPRGPAVRPRPPGCALVRGLDLHSDR